MNLAIKKQSATRFDLIVRKLSRKQAAGLIEEGHTHIHSTDLGKNDAGVKATLDRLASGDRQAPWLPTRLQLKTRIYGSQDRASVGKQTLSTLFSSERSSVKESIRLLIEEMTSNALYHAFKNEDKSDRYRRSDSVHLRSNEFVELCCHRSVEGAFLSVTDSGGALRIGDLAKCLKRCYARNGTEQIEKKASGAGLGFYMVFENTTHIEITVASGISTQVRVWLPTSGQIDPYYFSFNFWGGQDDTE